MKTLKQFIAEAHKVKLVPHPDNKDPEKFKKFHAHIDGEHVATVRELGRCPVTHVAQTGYKVEMLDGNSCHQRTRAAAAEWVANKHSSRRTK